MKSTKQVEQANHSLLHNAYSLPQLTSGMREQILGGHIDPLKAYAQLNMLAKAIKEVMDDRDVLDVALNEYGKYGSKAVTMGDCKIEQMESGTKYDYSVCQDSILEDMESNHKTLGAKIKERQEFLKHVPEKGMADPETGEVVYRPVKSSKTTLKITFKK